MSPVNISDGSLQFRKGYRNEWGLCRGGKKIDQAMTDLSQVYGGHINRMVVLIGTNDIMERAENTNQLAREKAEVKNSLIKLKAKLKRKCESILWMTIPPIPRFVEKGGEVSRRYEELLKKANDLIKSFADEKLSVLDLEAIVLKEIVRTQGYSSVFERLMGTGANAREDNIHLNQRGLEIMAEHLKKAIINVLKN